MDISFPPENGQLAVSIELLLLLRWLVQNDPDAIKKLVQQALKNGFGEQIASKKNPRNFSDVVDQLDLHLCVADFFSLIELALHKNAIMAEELALSKSPISPTISQIDMQSCDNETVALSIAKTTHALKKGTSTNAKETLCKELLKNWHPHTEIH
jgi:hypothetical protein